MERLEEAETGSWFVPLPGECKSGVLLLPEEERVFSLPLFHFFSKMLGIQMMSWE